MKVEINTGIIAHISFGVLPELVTQTNLWKTKIDNLLSNDYSYLYSNKELNIDLLIFENTDIFFELRNMLLDNKDNKNKYNIIKYLNNTTFKYLSYNNIKDIILETNNYNYLKGKADKIF